MAISDTFLQELHARVDIGELVSAYVNLRRRGNTQIGLCPFHNEKTPSFTVYSDHFYCFGCGAGGDSITFLRRIENLDYVEAVKSLAQRAGMPMPEDGFDDTLMRRRSEVLSANRAAAHFFHAQLQGTAAMQYLLDRGLTAKTIERFGLGYAPDSWQDLMDHLRGKGFSEQLLLEANLARKSEKNGRSNVYDNFRGRIMFPIIDLRGNVVAFGGRVMGDAKPKYINTSDTLVYKKSQGVFALNFAKNDNESKLIVAEGYMDVIALHQAGFRNAVACLGTALTKEQANLISRYAGEVILAYDADDAGQKATQRAMEIFGATGLKLRVLRLAGGKDPDEILRAQGSEGFKKLLEGAANDIEYRLLREREQFDLTTDDGKLRFLKAAAELLARLPGDIERDVYAARLAEELSVGKDAILQEAGRQRKQLAGKREKDRNRELQRELLRQGEDKLNPERRQHPRAARAEEVLLASLLRNPDYYGKLEEKLSLSADDFVTPFHRRVFTVIRERLEQGREVEPVFLSQAFTPEEMGRVTAWTVRGRETRNSLAECEDCIAVLREENSQNQSRDVAKLNDDEYLALFQRKIDKNNT